MFVYFALLKAILIAVLQGFCHFSGGILACLIIGSVLEWLVSVLMGDVDNVFIREVLYYASVLLQVVPMFVVSAGYLSRAEDDLNFIMAIALGWVCVVQTVLWFANGFEGAAGFAYCYSATVIVLIAEAILNAAFSLHTLLVVNFVIAAIALAVIIIARLAMGSNME